MPSSVGHPPFSLSQWANYIDKCAICQVNKELHGKVNVENPKIETGSSPQSKFKVIRVN